MSRLPARLDPNYRVEPPMHLRPQASDPRDFRPATAWDVTWRTVAEGVAMGFAFGGLIALCIFCA